MLPFEVPPDIASRPHYVLFDVDCVLVDLHQQPIMQMVQLAREAQASGCRLVLWSGGGDRHAREMAEVCGLQPDLCLRKPEYPIQPEAALAVLGHPPLMQFDDDPTEQVDGWPFMLVLEDGSIS